MQNQPEPSNQPTSHPASRPAPKPVTATDEGGRYERFGAPLVSAQTPVSATKLVANLDDWAGKTVQVEAKVHSTCPKMGCWMWVGDAGDRKVFVRFQDYAFFVPKTGAEGRRVIFEGKVSRKELSVEEARHYAEDAGDLEAAKKITEPTTIPFVMATGVKMYDAK